MISPAGSNVPLAKRGGGPRDLPVFLLRKTNRVEENMAAAADFGGNEPTSNGVEHRSRDYWSWPTVRSEKAYGADARSA